MVYSASEPEFKVRELAEWVSFEVICGCGRLSCTRYVFVQWICCVLNFYIYLELIWFGISVDLGCVMNTLCIVLSFGIRSGDVWEIVSSRPILITAVSCSGLHMLSPYLFTAVQASSNCQKFLEILLHHSVPYSAFTFIFPFLEAI